MKKTYINTKFILVGVLSVFLSFQVFAGKIDNRYLKLTYPDSWKISKDSSVTDNNELSQDNTVVDESAPITPPDNPGQDEKMNKEFIIEKDSVVQIQISTNKGETLNDVININELVTSVGGKVLETKKFKFKSIDAYKMTLESGNERILIFGFIKNGLTYSIKYSYPKSKYSKGVEKVIDGIELK